MSNSKQIDTQIIHAGEQHPRIHGAVGMPIFQSSTFEQTDNTAYDDIRYARLSNTPNHDVLHQKLAVLEGGEAALVTASGMAAISTTLLNVLKAGDHLIAQNCLYGGTQSFIERELAALGIETTFVGGNQTEQWSAAIRPNTRAFFCETLSNPLLELVDLKGIANFCQQHGVLSLIDNTFATPMVCRPLEHNFDVVLHSASKYLNGHSDLIAGAVISSAQHIERIRHKLNHFGGSLDPHACFLLHRGLKTLAVRVRQQCTTALTIASFLADHPAVVHVYYPGLATHGQHAQAVERLDGFGGMLSFELEGGTQAAQACTKKLKLATYAPSLGGPETLVTRPADSSHANVAPEQRRAQGIGDGLIRVSVGLEAADDLMADLDAALRS